MFKPQLVTLQRGALRLEPLSDADIPGLVALAEVAEGGFFKRMSDDFWLWWESE